MFGRRRQHPGEELRAPTNPLAFVFVLAVIGLVGFFLVSIYRWQVDTDRESRAKRIEHLTNDRMKQFDSFEVMLEQASSQRLWDELEKMSVGMNEALVVKLDKLQKQVQIADRLLEKGKDSFRVRAINKKLEALAAWNTLNEVNQLGDSTVGHRLATLIDASLKDPATDVRLQAHLIRALSRTYRYLKNPQPDRFESLKQGFEQAVKLVDNQADKANSLFNIAVLLQRGNHLDESVQLFKLLHDHFKDNPSGVIQTIANNAYDQYVFSEYDLAKVIRQIESGDESALSDFEQRVQRMVDGRQLTKRGVKRLYSMLEALVQTGQVEAALDLMKRIQTMLPRIVDITADPEIGILLDQMIQRAESVGEPFPVAWETLDGKSIDLDSLRGNVVLLIYWAPEHQKSVRRLGEIYNLGSHSKTVLLKSWPSFPGKIQRKNRRKRSSDLPRKRPRFCSSNDRVPPTTRRKRPNI